MKKRDDLSFLDDLGEPTDAGTVDALAELALAAVPLSPRSGGRARLMAHAFGPGRLGHYAEAVAEMLDLPPEAARALLDEVDVPASWTSEVPPPAQAFWVPGGPRAAQCVRGFVRIPAGESFPDHEHLGEERGLVLAGSFVDEALGRTLRPGDTFTMPAGTRHQPVVEADGVDLLMLVVVRGGYRVGELVLGPRD
jgi:quercetin dioxygenase-like cupin family protein